MSTRKEAVENELITLRRHEVSENFRDAQKQHQEYFAEHGHCPHDVEHLDSEDKLKLQTQRLEKLRREKVEFPTDEELMAEAKLK